MAEKKAQELDKAIASINKGVDKKEEMRLMMAPYANWDTFLSPAPQSIALLGHLIIISSDTDFSLQDKKGSINFEVLKYPDSFRASLVQVSHKGWDAFNKAHTSMDQIRLYSSNVDKHVKTAVKFLVAGSAEDVKLMVPNALKNIERIADDCLELATSVETEFVLVMKLIAELLEACTRAKGEQEENLKAARIAHEVAEEQMKAMKEEKEQAVKKRSEMEKQMKEANEEYKESMNSMPSTMEIVEKAFADTFISATRAASAVPNMLLGRLRSAIRVSRTSEDTANSNPLTKSEEILDLYRIVPDIHGQVLSLVTLASHGKFSETDGVLRVQARLQQIMEWQMDDIAKSDMKTRVRNHCRNAIEFSNMLLSMGNHLTNSENEIQEAKRKAKNLRDEAETLLSISHAVVGNNALPNTSPNLAKQQVHSADSGMVEQALGSYRFRTETAKEMLKDSRKAYEKSCDDVAKRTKDMGKLLAEMKGLDLKKVDMEQIKQTLVKGVKALAELREQWGKMVEFFQMLSNIVKCCLNTSLKSFVETSQNRLAQTESSMSAVMRDTIFEQAFQANQIAYVVNSISSVYVEVSHKHLMERITCLGKLIALDPVSDEHEIRIKRQELNQGCDEAQKAISKIASEKKKEMTEAIDQRIKRIEREVEALLPPISESEVKEIRQKVKDGIAMGKADLEAQVEDLC